MVVILDTAAVPPPERFERVRAAMAETSASSVALPGGGHPVSARLDLWQLGDSYLFRAATSPVRMSLDASHFTRRFRREYGMSPSNFRVAVRPANGF